MIKIKLPNRDICTRITSRTVYNMVYEWAHQHGVPTTNGEARRGADLESDAKYLVWDGTYGSTASLMVFKESHGLEELSLAAFLDAFVTETPPKKILSKVGGREAFISSDGLTVGCTTIPFSEVDLGLAVKKYQRDYNL